MKFNGRFLEKRKIAYLLGSTQNGVKTIKADSGESWSMEHKHWPTRLQSKQSLKLLKKKFLVSRNFTFCAWEK